jgi:preprotein translocase subunit YajC
MMCDKLIEYQGWLAMAPTGDEQGGGFMSFLPMILILVAFYFLLIAPQRKKQKQHDKMVQALEKGTQVKTLGGIFGTVTGVKDDRFVLRIGENVKIEVAKEAIAAKID